MSLQYGELHERTPLERAVLGAYTEGVEEARGSLEIVEGEVPPELRGVLYANGPGRFERGGVPYGHVFDGDGLVLRLGFTDAGVSFRSRFVRTRELVAEEAAGRILYRGLGTDVPGGLGGNLLRLPNKNAANTGIVYHGGKLLALWEGGLPHALDPDTLETIGRYDYEGRLRARPALENRLFGDELPYAAHPRIDPATGDLWSFGLRAGPHMRLLLYRADPHRRLDPPREVRLDGLWFVHDFALTARFQVFLLSPLRVRALRSLVGAGGPGFLHSLASDPARPMEILLVPRDGGEPVRISASSGFVFHVVNGYEEAGDRIVVDAVRFDRFPVPRVGVPAPLAPLDFPPGHLTRYVIDPRRRSATEERLIPTTVEFPGIHPLRVSRRHRYVWALGGREGEVPPLPRHTLIKLDVERRSAVVFDRHPDLLGEPVFAPRPGAVEEDDGWVICRAHAPERGDNDLLVLDARSMKLVARVRLPRGLPPGLHGSWVPAPLVAADSWASRSNRDLGRDDRMGASWA
jgi:all-trans-8'-apo-beta-carotenal 15,15'-oxygenase